LDWSLRSDGEAWGHFLPPWGRGTLKVTGRRPEHGSLFLGGSLIRWDGGGLCAVSLVVPRPGGRFKGPAQVFSYLSFELPFPPAHTLLPTGGVRHGLSCSFPLVGGSVRETLFGGNFSGFSLPPPPPKPVLSGRNNVPGSVLP